MEQEKINIENMFNSIAKYLKLVHTDVYELPDRFTSEDENAIIKAGFKPELCSYYDGKILKATDENIATHSTKCQCLHSIYMKNGLAKKYEIEFHVVESDRRWSIDEVYEKIGKDDEKEDNYFVLNKGNEVEIGKIEDLTDLPVDIRELFLRLKEHINEKYKSLRIRLIIK